ncbi:MAG: hypothetical protein ACP5G1_04835, partial [Nanopusillaceae archaeon]
MPLSLLNTYTTNYNSYTYSNLNYNPFQYGTLEIGSATGGIASYQYIQWVVARAYPPNGVMPSIAIQPITGYYNKPSWYAITINNTQNTNTPAPFQQVIAICNGNLNANTITYINNPDLLATINATGSNVFFSTSLSGNPNIYSWYEGSENLNGVICDVWWLNISQGIPANSGLTIYMYVGKLS